MTHAAAESDAIIESKPAAPGDTATAPGVADAIDPATLTGAIEAILLSADRPVPALKLAAALGLIPDAPDDAPPENAPADEAATTPAPASDDAAPATTDAAPTADATSDTPPAPPVKTRKPRRKNLDAAAAQRAKSLDAVRAAIDLLNHAYEHTTRAFRIESLAGGYRVMTLPAHADAIARYRGARAKTAMSPAALEALAIIAYKQPMTRAKLEAIRGVACGEILRTLLDRKLITITGRAEELGRPLLYGTSKRFLELFGLATLKDLPSVEELRTKN